MIDPYHMYLARRPSARASAAAAAKKPSTDSTTGSNSNSNSKSSSVDSKSQQSTSYFGGDSLSPTSTASSTVDNHATTTTIRSGGTGGSSSSASNNVAGAAALGHKLPEFEHFRQNSPLMPEFYPRTSEFFSQGRRRSSIAVSDAIGAAAAAGGSDAGRRGSGGSKKAETFHLPGAFEEVESMHGEQLPVRLGLAPPSHSHGLAASEVTYKAKVGHGFYFYTPPPPAPTPATRAPASSAKMTAPGSLRRRNTDTSDTLPLAAHSKTTPQSSTLQPSAASSSSTRARADSSLSSLPATTLVGHEASSRTTRVPPPSPDCWHPDSYFTTIRSRVKGKLREYVHHAFPPSAVPYWHGYNAETVEAEMTTHLNFLSTFSGHTLRDFPEGSRPSRVLDLGCGRGMWCIDLAKEWKTTEFVGLDIVPIQPALATMGDADLEHRVSWVVANYLEPLPFPDASFDFVHVRFIAQGVPEDKWADLFTEARRVLAPGGVLEVVDGNYNFFGHASLVDAQELKDIEHGSAGKKGSGIKLPKRLKVLNDGSDSADVDAIEVILERMMHRRFINPTPLSVVPSAMLLPGFANVATGNPRHIPVYAESTAQRCKNSDDPSSATATSSEDEEKHKGKFTSRTQIGKPLNSLFAMRDKDLFCALCIIQYLCYISSSRELLWAEAEEEKAGLRGVAQPELPRMDTSRRFGQGNPAALKPFAHPWKSKDAFFRALDHYIDATRVSADTEHMLRKYLGWEQIHEDLTVEGRKFAERRRKMSTSSMIPSLAGMEQLGLEDNAERQEEASKKVAQDTVTGSGAFEMATTHAQEAPARLQSAPNASEAEATAAGKADKKKSSSKKVKRPSSSGGASSSSVSPATATPTSPASTITSPFGRARTFGRGGAGVAAALPVAVPDAPSFMSGYAFAPPTATELRGPLQKGRIVEPSSRIASGRKASSSKSFSDRSSVSGKTAAEDAGAGKMSMTATPAGALGAGTAISPAAAYAANQRKSHGLEDEFRMQAQEDIHQASEGDRSRPVSPTSPAVAQGTTLGAKPVHLSQGGSAESRSVSMPVQAEPGVRGVRIAEPPSRPSKMMRARSKSNSSKTRAMLTFYDCAGWLATA